MAFLSVLDPVTLGSLGALRETPQVIQVVLHVGGIEAEAAEQPETAAAIDPADRLFARDGGCGGGGTARRTVERGCGGGRGPADPGPHTSAEVVLPQIVQVSDI